MGSDIGFTRIDTVAFADEGEFRSICSVCGISQVCMSDGAELSTRSNPNVAVEDVGPLQPGEHVFRQGDAFGAIAVVRSGTLKTYRVTRDGDERVLGFHLPGAVIGLDAVDRERYTCNAVVLETASLCRVSFPKIATMATHLPKLQQQLFRVMSRDIGNAALFAGDNRADERMAAFLVGLSRRLAARGFPPTRFRLTMSRTDIANFLRQTPETVSRVFRHFEQDGLARVEQRDVEILDLRALEALARAVSED